MSLHGFLGLALSEKRRYGRRILRLLRTSHMHL